jgi:hypothetical protein
MSDNPIDLSLEERIFADSFVQGVDVLALNWLDDDDTTQSSTTIKEDRSFVFYREEEEGDDDSMFEDAEENHPPYPLAIQAYETAKNLWSFGKTTRSVGTFLNATEGVCQRVAQKVGISRDLETKMLKPHLQAVDHSLTPAYTVIANAWNGWFPPKEKEMPKTISFAQSFEDDSDEDMWIAFDPPPPTTMPISFSFQEKQQEKYQQREQYVSSL